MSKDLAAKMVGQDADLLHRSMDIRISSQQRMITPLRAVDAKIAFEHRTYSPIVANLFEYFRAPRSSTINGWMTNKDKEQKFTSEVNSVKSHAGDKPFLMFIDYAEEKYPNPKELEFIVRSIHTNSDMATMPLISRLTDNLDADKGFDDYVSFLTEAMNVINTYNRKPIMGVIPLKTPFIRIQDLVDFYSQEGVKALCLDFSTSKPHTVSQSVEQVLYSLAKQGELDTTYIHAINVSPGRPRSNTLVAPCRSILSYGFGVDSYGDLHRSRMKIDNPIPVPATPPVRVFSIDNYGDYIVTSQSSLQAIPKCKSGVGVQNCVGSKGATRLFNAEQHSIEAEKLGSLVKGQLGAQGVEAYLKKKAYVEESDIKKMRSLVKRARPRS